MAETNYIYANARFAFRSDTLANWESANPILLAGEFGVATDGSESEKIKIGDGVTTWNELGWWRGPKGDTGYTPQKSIDYFTDDDKQEIINSLLPEIYNAELNANSYTDEKVGDIETALDNIITMQNNLIGGDA